MWPLQALWLSGCTAHTFSTLKFNVVLKKVPRSFNMGIFQWFRLPALFFPANVRTRSSLIASDIRFGGAERPVSVR